MSEFQQALDDMEAILKAAPEVVVEDDAPSPDIEIEKETSANSSEYNIAQKNNFPQKKKHDNTFKRRIADITAAKYEREQQLLIKEQENNYLRQLLVQKDSEISQKEDYASQQFESNLQAREIAIRNELINAKEESDHTREVELENALFEIKAQKHTNELYKHQIKPERQNYASEYQPTYTQPYQPEYEQPINEHYMDWTEENTWANPNDPDFDQSLYQEAVNISTELERGLKLKKQSHLIGTKEFYETISRVMEENYGLQSSEGDYEEAALQNTQTAVPNYSQSQYQVAPVNQGKIPMSNQYNRPQQPRSGIVPGRMSRAEYEVARNLQIKDINGKVINDEAARLKLYDQGKKYPASPNGPGHSGYRFTVL